MWVEVTYMYTHVIGDCQEIRKKLTADRRDLDMGKLWAIGPSVASNDTVAAEKDGILFSGMAGGPTTWALSSYVDVHRFILVDTTRLQD